jgi:hypothetical protein
MSIARLNRNCHCTGHELPAALVKQAQCLAAGRHGSMFIVDCRAAGLEGKKLEAEAYQAKQQERLRWNITGNTLLQRGKEVRTYGNS